MDYAIRWSPEALADVEAIAAYISRDSAFYARAVVGKILDIARDLKNFPLIGRVLPEINDPSIRERFVYSYRLIYQIEDANITVLAVIHGKRLLENARLKGHGLGRT